MKNTSRNNSSHHHLQETTSAKDRQHELVDGFMEEEMAIEPSQPFIQTKLSVGAPNDPFEQEADNIAETITKGEKTPAIQRSAMGASAHSGVNVPNEINANIEASKGKGAALDDQTKAEMESSLGEDFSDVSVHTGSESAAMNDALGARAFTVGSDIHFNAGQYNPGSTEGKKLLAHELVHTVQQRGQSDKKIQPKLKEYEKIYALPTISKRFPNLYRIALYYNVNIEALAEYNLKKNSTLKQQIKDKYESLDIVTINDIKNKLHEGMEIMVPFDLIGEKVDLTKSRYNEDKSEDLDSVATGAREIIDEWKSGTLEGIELFSSRVVNTKISKWMAPNLQSDIHEAFKAAISLLSLVPAVKGVGLVANIYKAAKGLSAGYSLFQSFKDIVDHNDKKREASELLNIQNIREYLTNKIQEMADDFEMKSSHQLREIKLQNPGITKQNALLVWSTQNFRKEFWKFDQSNITLSESNITNAVLARLLYEYEANKETEENYAPMLKQLRRGTPEATRLYNTYKKDQILGSINIMKDRAAADIANPWLSNSNNQIKYFDTDGVYFPATRFHIYHFISRKIINGSISESKKSVYKFHLLDVMKKAKEERNWQIGLRDRLYAYTEKHGEKKYKYNGRVTEIGLQYARYNFEETLKIEKRWSKKIFSAPYANESIKYTDRGGYKKFSQEEYNDIYKLVKNLIFLINNNSTKKASYMDAIKPDIPHQISTNLITGSPY